MLYTCTNFHSRRSNADKENISPTTKGKDADIEKKMTYQAYGRHIGRLIDFSQIIDHIIETGIKRELDDDENEDEDPNAEDEGNMYVNNDLLLPVFIYFLDYRTKRIAIRRQCEDWDVLCNKIPGFKESMMMLASKRTLRHDVARHVRCLSDINDQLIPSHLSLLTVLKQYAVMTVPR